MLPRILTILLLLAAIVWAAGRTLVVNPPAGAQTTSRTSADDWRRTANGWQRRSDWSVEPASPTMTPAAKVHPLLVALIVLLLSVESLLAFSPDHKNRANRAV